MNAAGQEIHALDFDQLQCQFRLEIRLQHDRPAGRKRETDGHRNVAGPEEAVAGPAAYRALDFHDAWIAPPLQRERALRVQDALGQTGGTGRKEQHAGARSEENTSELQSLMRSPYAVF